MTGMGIWISIIHVPIQVENKPQSCCSLGKMDKVTLMTKKNDKDTVVSTQNMIYIPRLSSKTMRTS